jgi:hypothetical protein
MSAREDMLLPFGSGAQFTGIVNDGTFEKNIIHRRDAEKYKKIIRIFSA